MNFETFLVNIPVKNLERSIQFYSALGFSKHPVFQGPGASCLCISAHANLMLQTEEHFRKFTAHPIPDSSRTTGLLLCVHCDSPSQVNDLVKRALVAGGTTTDEAQDLGFLYTHGFVDPDGYVWKLNHIYPNRSIEHAPNRASSDANE